jgi:hypothetical protein
MNEWSYYDARDKHQIAFRSLEDPRSQEMAEQLGYLDRKATEIEACLACHAVQAVESKQFDPIAKVEGVTCVGCHGAYADWVNVHPEGSLLVGRSAANRQEDRRIDWTCLSRVQKERQFGMTDLWDPVRRAETCAACHVGNFDQGKVITHAMYAAGHPPLPSFEAATFGDAQPRHWQNLREKTPERQQRFNPRDIDKLEQTRLVVVSGLVVLRERMTLFAAVASASKLELATSQSTDFARFDCYACHHELARHNGGGWRRMRNSDGHPGRPTVPEWPLVLIPLAIDACGPQEREVRQTQLQQLLAEFHESQRSRPFGDPARAVPAARRVAAWADSLLTSLRTTTFDAPMAERLLERLGRITLDRIPDYDSARQIAWAFRVIYHETTPKQKQDSTIEHVLSDLEADLALNLSAGNQRVPIKDSLRERLRSIAEFDQESFQTHFEMITDRLAHSANVPPTGR